jgi:two-component system, LuxR family, response regulator FixJ
MVPQTHLAGPGRVVLVDDDPAIRDAYQALLLHEGYECEVYSNAIDCLRQCGMAPLPVGPVCVLCDVKMPGIDGLELLRQIRQRLGWPLVLMSGESGAREAVKGLKGGAEDFLVKPIDADDLLQAVERALENSRNQQLRQHLHDDEMHRLAQLSPREREAVYWIVRGFTNAEAAARMGIALRTIKRHRHLAMEKLGLDSLTDLVRVLDTHAERFDPLRRESPPTMASTPTIEP